MSCDEFSKAALRSVRVLEYHLECLEKAYDRQPDANPVVIPVQAHFEGVLGSFGACADQIAAGLHTLTANDKQWTGLETFLVDSAPERGPVLALQRLWRSPERRDISEVRRFATQYSYDEFAENETYRVAVYTDDPIPERDLVSYSRSVLALASKLSAVGAAALRSLH